MITYGELTRKPRRFLALTGYTVEEFQVLLPYFRVIIDETCEILYLAPTYEGRKHDKRIAGEAGYIFPEGRTVCQDTGFQGFRPEGVLIVQPKKQSKGSTHARLTAS